MQIELAQHLFGARQHALVFILAGFRRGDRDQFDLGELVLPDHAAGVAPGGAGFGAEALGQRGQAHRQFFFLEDGFAHQVGQRHLGGGDEPVAHVRRQIIDHPHFEHQQIVELQFGGRLVQLPDRHVHGLDPDLFVDLRLADRRRGAELVVAKFRQLSGAEHGRVLDQQRRIDFGIAVCGRVQVEHELPDRALQPRQSLLQYDKARARELGGRREIHEAQ